MPASQALPGMTSLENVPSGAQTKKLNTGLFIVENLDNYYGLLNLCNRF